MKRILIGLCCALGISAWAFGDSSFVAPVSIPATACTNQFIRSIAAATGIGTCATVSLMADVTGALAVANGGSGDTGSAWTSYTPTAGCGTSGTITTDTISGLYKLLPAYRTAIVQIDINISTLGTCLGSLFFSIPNNAIGATAYVGGAFNLTTTTAVPVLASGTTIQLAFVTAPAANHYYLTVTYQY